MLDLDKPRKQQNILLGEICSYAGFKLVSIHIPPGICEDCVEVGDTVL